MRYLIILLCFILSSCISEPKKESTENTNNLKQYVYAYAKVKEYSVNTTTFETTFIKSDICCTDIVTLNKKEAETIKSALKKYYNHGINNILTSNDFKGLWDRDNVAPFQYEIDVSTIDIKKSFDWDEIIRVKKKHCDCDNFLINTLDE